jgi:putative spermidine/putrescine transport system ATP-binding protein
VIYVTHDQGEALTMSDRIAIFSAGKIAQLGTGEDLYDRPASLFVADFIGDSNIFKGRFVADADGAWLARGDGRWRVGSSAAERAGLGDGSSAALVIRPERMRLAVRAAPPPAANAVDATVTEVLFLGPVRRYDVALPDGEHAVVRVQAGTEDHAWQAADRVSLTWTVEDAVLVADEA